MMAIPPTIDSDAEDVVWALQTAEALWKRNERVDAIVWLRRAAQAAGDAEDDDRALALARGAAELAEWIADNPYPAGHYSTPPPSDVPTPAEAVDELLRRAKREEALAGAPSAAGPSPRSSSSFRASPRVPSAAEAHAGMLDPWAEGPPRQRPVVRKERSDPPRLPPSAPRSPVAARAFEVEEVVTSAPPMTSPAAARRAAAAQPAAAAVPSTTGVDLTEVEAFGDLPDDARDAFARAATVQSLARDEEVSGFALALVLEGGVDLSATIVDACAKRLDAGAVLRARGSIEQVTPLRLVGASDDARVATWDEQAVTEAFRTCPWVEDELRVAGDLLQALVGVTMGPLGDRLDSALRADITSKLRLRTLGDHEIFATRGTIVSGLLVVGAGELELLAEDGEPNGTVLRAGEFVFPHEALRAAPAPSTVRAAKGGALVLLAERGVAQELLVTCPPLLEIFAGG
jgi:hypothetical protein